MANWVDAATARNDLRRFVNDGPKDRPIKNKIAVGVTDGNNKTFLTWDDRIIDTSLLVNVDLVQVAANLVTVNDAVLGQFTLTNAPAPTSTVRTSYFFQYFLDEDLDEALVMAAQETVEGDLIVNIPSGLKLAALHFGGHFAYQKMAMRWAQRMSARFLVEEEPVEAETMGRSNLFRQIANDLWKTAIQLREGFYTRHGRREAPAFNVVKPRLPTIGPRT